MRRALLSLMMVLTWACVLLVSRSVLAGPLRPMCEVELVATPIGSTADPVCAAVAWDDLGAVDSAAAPICDPTGASAVAPPRILPVSDARLEASPFCGRQLLRPAADRAPEGDILSSGQGWTVAALLPPLLSAPAPVPMTPIDDTLATDAPDSPGFAAGVYRPPR